MNLCEVLFGSWVRFLCAQQHLLVSRGPDYGVDNDGAGYDFDCRGQGRGSCDGVGVCDVFGDDVADDD